jgi:Phospholipase_D-nuclease N-terminal
MMFRAAPRCTMRGMFAADYPFLDILWTMIIFFTWVVWIWMMIYIFTDLFRRRDIGGFAKAAWAVFMIILPFLGVLIYLIAQHDGITQRNLEQSQAAERAFDARVQQAAAATQPANGGGAASEIQKAQELLTAGAINQAEFDQIKSRALAAH